MDKKPFVLNAFSVQMVRDALIANGKVVVEFSLVDKIPFQECESAIGHEATAEVLGVPMNRINVTLNPGDEAYIAQLVGGRLPEGCTTLPEGFSFDKVKVRVD